MRWIVAISAIVRIAMMFLASLYILALYLGAHLTEPVWWIRWPEILLFLFCFAWLGVEGVGLVDMWWRSR